MGSMFLTNATADADGKLDKPLDASVRNLGRLPDYMMKAAMLEAVAVNPVSSAAVTKIWVDKEKKLGQQLFLFCHAISPRLDLWTLDKRALLLDLQARRAEANNPIVLIPDLLNVMWETQGFYMLDPEMPAVNELAEDEADGEEANSEAHQHIHLVLRMTGLKVTQQTSRHKKPLGVLFHGDLLRNLRLSYWSCLDYEVALLCPGILQERLLFGSDQSHRKATRQAGASQQAIHTTELFTASLVDRHQAYSLHTIEHAYPIGYANLYTLHVYILPACSCD